MKINLGNIKFVRKDKKLFSNRYRTVMEETKTGYIYEDNTEGVAIIPYRMGANGKEILIRDEYTPLHDTVLSIITGRRDPDDTSWQATARRELLEEAGILAEERWFIEVGEILPAGSYKRPDIMCIVDVTGVHQGKPETDGSIFEKKSTNMWVPVSDLLRMIREPRADMDSYLLSAITKFLSWNGMLGKSEEIEDLEKAKKGEERHGHKYIRRKPKKSGKAGYDYIYQEPKGKGPKKAESGKKPSLIEQLAALVGKKQGGEEEKKPKKQFPWDEFASTPPDMPDFKKGTNASQWVNILNSMVTSAVNSQLGDLDDADYDMMNDPLNVNSFYADAAIKMLDSVENRYSASESDIDEIKVENNKLADNAKREVKRAIISASFVLCNINHMTAVLNGSIVENVFDNFSYKMNGDRWRSSTYVKMDELSAISVMVKNRLGRLNETMQNIKWLQGSDPKLDWMVDQVYEAADNLMKARNRFSKNGLKFFINELTPKIESLKDAEEVDSAGKLLEQFEIFINEVIYSSTTSRTLGVFANQWNLKEKGIYDGASRFSAYAAGKIVDKIKGLESLGDDDIIKGYIQDFTKNNAFDFLTMSPSESPFRVSEQIFSYIDMHGMDKYYQDMVFFTGGRDSGVKTVDPFDISSVNKANHYKETVTTLTKAYNGENVYHDDDALFQSEQSNGGMGSMRKGKYAAIYTAMNTMILMNPNSPIESKVPAFIRMWSLASHNSLISNAIEEFVQDKGIDRGSYVNYHIASNRTVMPRRAAVKDALGDTIGKIYKNTQEELADATRGPVSLFRGNGDSELKSAVSSWTSIDHIAASFGHIVSKVDAPIESILIANNDDFNESYWTYPQEREYILVPGLLTADKKLQPEQLLSEQRQSILDKKLEHDAEIYNEYYS